MERTSLDVYTIIGIIIAILLALLGPSIPKIDSPLSILILLSSAGALIMIVFLIDSYLKSKKKQKILEITMKNMQENYKNLEKEINLLQERFKISEELMSIRERIVRLEGKNERRYK